MEMEYFRTVHYPEHAKPVSELGALENAIYEYLLLEPMYTGPLRKKAMADFGCSKSQFDTALKKLQISLNIVRSNNPELTNDQWVPFKEVHQDIVAMYSE